MPDFRFSPKPNRAREIPWRPWSSEAFAQAERERKPILLAISAVWCHWCHVMDETTYSDPEVITSVRERYVPVRVDNDERPDVNARYNMGGWPTTAFLAPDGTTLTGATYLPPEQMRTVLDEVARWYEEHREEVARRAAEMREMRHTGAASATASLRSESVEAFAKSVAQNFDEEYAGFGDAPKFPQPELLEFLLLESEMSGNERYLSMVVRTLLAMARGGMYDHVEGGFFRYSTTRDWSIPHFEKMAEDHAGLVRVLALLLARTRHDELRATLRSALGYLMTVLRDRASGFFAGSQDADEEYYALPLEERRERKAPYVDRTVYADRNAALAGALVLAGAVLDDDAIVSAATRTLDAIRTQLRDPDGLLYHVRRPGEAPSVRGLLADQSSYLRALLDAHDVTHDAHFLDDAMMLFAAIEQRFSAEGDGFYDHAGIEERLGRLALADRPITENALIAESLIRLSAVRGEERYRAAAQRILLLYANTFAHAGAFAAAYARALRRFLSPSLV